MGKARNELVALPPTGTAGVHPFPSSITTDAQGRVTATGGDFTANGFTQSGLITNAKAAGPFIKGSAASLNNGVSMESTSGNSTVAADDVTGAFLLFGAVGRLTADSKGCNLAGSVTKILRRSAVNTAFAIANLDYMIVATAVNLTFTLPSIATIRNGMHVVVKDGTGNAGSTLTIQPNALDQIDGGGAGVALAIPGAFVRGVFVADATSLQWWRIG